MTFLDTNILVYSIDPRDQRKHEIAKSIVASARHSPFYAISVQVVNEFCHVALRKFKKPISEVIEFVELFQGIYSCAIRNNWTIEALEIMQTYNLQFYDSMLLAAAHDLQCDTFLSEDLNDGQIYCGIKAINPFKGI